MAKAWTNLTDYVDVETGVLIGKKEMQREYEIINKTIKIKYSGRHNIRQTTIECRKSRQLRLL